MSRKPNLFLKIALIACCGLFCGAIKAQAQFLGYTSPQTVQTVLASAGTACTGSQVFTVPNFGQTQHYVYLIPSAISKLVAEIDGVDNAGQIYRISDQMLSPTGGSLPLVITASGYFPIVKVTVACTSGSFTLNYSGASSTTNVNAGVYMLAQSNKVIFPFLAANANQFTPNNLQPPFLNSAGKIVFSWVSAPGPAGSSLSVYCGTIAASAGAVAYELIATFPLDASATSLQQFTVPPSVCPQMEVAYTSGGASSQNFQAEYVFTQPTFVNATAGLYQHITGTTATAVKTYGGTVTQITVGTSAAGTVSIFDLITGSCTGTPATNTVAVLTIAATQPPVTIPLNLTLNNGICVKASVAMDLTVGFQ